METVLIKGLICVHRNPSFRWPDPVGSQYHRKRAFDGKTSEV